MKALQFSALFEYLRNKHVKHKEHNVKQDFTYHIIHKWVVEYVGAQIQCWVLGAQIHGVGYVHPAPRTTSPDTEYGGWVCWLSLGLITQKMRSVCSDSRAGGKFLFIKIIPPAHPSVVLGSKFTSYGHVQWEAHCVLRGPLCTSRCSQLLL